VGDDLKPERNAAAMIDVLDGVRDHYRGIREEGCLLLDRGIAMAALKGPASAEHAQIASVIST
jgi:hypothetical protein